MRLLVRAAQPERQHLYAAVLWLACATAFDVLAPWLGKHVIDQYLRPGVHDFEAILWLVAGAFLAGSFASLLRYLQLRRLAGLAMRSVQRVREQVFSHVLHLPMAYFDRAITGQLVSRVTNDTEQVKALYVQVLFVLLDSGILLLGTMVAMAFLDWRLMLIVLLLAPLVLVIVRLYQKLSAPAVARTRELRSEINAQMAESIGGMSVLQASNAAPRFSQRFHQANEQQYLSRMREMRANAWMLRPMLDMLNILLTVAILYAFGRRPLDAMEVGVLYAFLSYTSRVVDPLIQITMQFSQLQQAIIASARVTTLLDEAAQDQRQGQAQIEHGGLRLEQVRFAYNEEQTVLHGLDLEIKPGQFFGIVGHTGSGKSTLLSLLLRFYQPQQGRILLDGHALQDLSKETFRSKLGLAPQDPFLLASSVAENIAMGRTISRAQIEAAAKAAHAHDFICALEQGYDTPLGEGGSRLSSGQKQLISLARALAGEPRILLLDEATAHIDSETEQIVQKALQQLHGKVTIIAIAHRLSTIRDADQIVVLNHGRIAEQGRHEELMGIEQGIYQRLYLLQQLDV
ncbi:ABC transporter ATP-binding protein [Massilia sp. W12]|uniref:ABC transporter ATP-binding protein n=1 Tax=Massilia sp. W12 TaxID=3126507 RepID=UPI0030D514BE